MKNKKQKLISKIICAALAFFVFTLNSGLAQVAYAATPSTAPTKAAPLDCKGWNLGDDKLTCYKVIKKEEKDARSVLCPSGFIKLDWASFVATEDGGLRMVCGPKSTAQPADLGDITRQISLLLGVQEFLSKLIWPVLVLIGGLMENDLLFANGMEEKLREIWIPMRNLVNILFVIVLVGLALYNVLGLAEDNTSIKSMLPKIIVGIIAVNFSFVAIKVMLDGINVLTTSIFALPGNINEELAKITADDNSPTIKRFCLANNGQNPSQMDDTDISDQKAKQEKEFKTYHEVAEGENYKDAGIKPGDQILDMKNKITTVLGQAVLVEFEARVAAKLENSLCSGNKLTPLGKTFLSHYNSRNAAFAMALNMGKIVFYSDVKLEKTDGQGIEAFFTNALFSVVLYLVYAASFLALFAVLLGRLVVMWLSIAVSPLLLLMIASPTLKEKMGGLSKLSEQFTKNAIAPLLISLSLTVGWIMLRAIQITDFGKAGAYIGGSFAINVGNGIPVASLSTLQDFVVALGVIAVVWMGVFSAAEGTVAQFATDIIKQKVESAGKWVGSLPFKHMPIVPIQLPDHPHGQYENFTLSSVDTALSRLMDKDNSRSDNALLEAMGEKIGKVEDVRTVTTPDTLLEHLNTMSRQKQLGTDSWRREIKDWKSVPGNVAVLEKLKTQHGDQGRAIAAAIDILAKPDSIPDDVSKAIKTIAGSSIVKAKDSANTSTTTDSESQPIAEPEKAAAPAITDKTQIDGKELGQIFVKNSKPDTDQIAKVITARDALTVAITDNANDPTLIKAKLADIGKIFTTTNVTKANLANSLKAMIGEDQYEALEAALRKSGDDTPATTIAAQLDPTPPPPPGP